MLRTLLLMLLSFTLASPLPPAFKSSEAINSEINTKIRTEEMEHSQVMRTLHMLTDVYGPRLTGSPNHKAAGEWAIKQMTQWGLQNAKLEPWDFGYPGWLNERLSAHITSPVKDALVCEALAWTPGTNGAVSGKAFSLVIPQRPTQEALTQYFNSVKDQVRGKIVLVGAPVVVPVNITPPPKRMDDAQAKARFDPANASSNQGPPFNRGPRPEQQQQPPQPGQLTPLQVAEQTDAFLLANGVLVRINDAGREHGQIRAFNNRTFDVAKVVPTVVMRNEDYGRIYRLLGDQMPVELEFNIVNHNYPEGKTSYNAVAEIPGTDKRDEVIMLGGHLDSWHSATGATDNAVGCTIMMEAARILKTIGVTPRRTIRVALWGGEEQGLLGSQAYVKQHFGAFEDPKLGFEKFGGYFNVDTGTGRIRGMSVFGPPEAAQVLREILTPFQDFGVMGALPSLSRGLGGSDNTSFSNAGLPGIGCAQDPIEYNSATWHTNLDTYERIIEDDVRKSAMVIASAVYHLAMRDELLPRLARDKMPPPPPRRGEGAPAQTAAPATTTRPNNNR